MNKPKTFRDLDFMISTSKEWFDGCVKYENTNNPVEEGQINSISWHVCVHVNCVEVYKSIHVIHEVRNEHFFSCTTERKTIAKYNTMEEFESSEWYELAMDRFSGGDSDTSWLDTITVNEQNVDTHESWTGYGEYTYVDMEVGKTYNDFLNNSRQRPGHGTLSIKVDRMSGELSLYFENYYVEDMTVEKLQQAVVQYDKLKKLGVKITDDSINVPLLVDKEE